MAYTSLCLKSFDTFKQGSLYTCYEEDRSVFLRPIDSMGPYGNYTRIDWHDHRKNFEFFSDFGFIFLPLSEDRKRLEFIEKIITKLPFSFCKNFRSPVRTVPIKKSYRFKIAETKLFKIYKVLLPLFLLERESPEFLFQFSKSIDYALKTLENMCELDFKIDVDVDLDKEIAMVGELFNEIYLFYKEIKPNSIGEDQVKDFLEKHHAVMGNVTDHIKLYRSL
ncbi:hypothetical protein [Bacillus subtilis]|uniref:hypothetical protein n=1 Tax=Bacillus subtilis TaxID=1423 RepID=UPI000849F431|nr:hypothetical protein [Bacillus subtilis]ODV47938.1 hypothetical protein BCM26_05900 [Bacillus subtilis]OJH63536.1 hypothetical protein BOH71_09845 [Bacillus subtilis]